MRSQSISRREFIAQTSVGLAVTRAGSGMASAMANPQPPPQAKPPGTPHAERPGIQDAGHWLNSHRIWDVHCHLEGFAGATIDAKVDNCLRFADRMGVERMLVLTSANAGRMLEADGMRAGNDRTLRAVKKAPDRLFGCAFMYPGILQTCLDEIDRTVRDGPLIGLKFAWDTAAGADTPDVDAIFERAGKYQAVIMHCSWIVTGGNFVSEPGGHSVGESTPMQLAAVARRHPNVTVFCGHTGGNWELGIRAIRDVKNMFSDLSGSDQVAGFTEMAVRELGAERVLYGSDISGRSFSSQLGKVLGADLPESARRLILRENMRRLLQPVLKSKGIVA